MSWATLGICCLMLAGWARADVVDMMVENERTEYLLYEPLVLKVTLTNNSGQDLVFEDTGDGRSWLDFLVTNDSNRAVIKKDHTASFKPLVLSDGASKSLQVNVTPLYNIRETGSFHLQVVVQVGGREFVSSPTQVTIVNGQTIWQSKRTVEGSLLTYSLIRFTPDPNATYLYLRVEDEAENAVYVTERLGEIISFSDPKVEFDAENNLHILHVNGRGMYRYTRVNAKGGLITRDNFDSVNDLQPQLFKTKDGSVLVQGGRKEDQSTRRELLSAAQALMRPAPEKPLGTTLPITPSEPSAVPPLQK